MDDGTHESADHAARMDGVYRFQRHLYDLTRKYYLLGRDQLIERLDVPVGGTILEIGCGTGRNLILAAQRYPDCQLFGLDISPAMLKTACRAIERAGLSGRIVLAQADAARFDPQQIFGIARFDRIFASYTLSMIPEWRAAIKGGLAACKDGGAMHLVDFGAFQRLPHWFAQAMHGWLTRFHVKPREDLADFVTHLAIEQGCRAEIASLYRDYAILVRITRQA
ncbi:MAG: class I SAM-dependent methyltransferase [Blastomonas sp.]